MPIPVTLVAGFLGAGKTTLLRRLLEACPPEERYGVIVNEFGALGVDGELVVRGGNEESTLVELSNGCICCEIQDDLRVALLSMTRAAQRRRLLGRRRRPLTRILIEASGAASPGPAVQTFLVDAELEAEVSLEGVVSVCNTALLEEQLAGTEEAGPQVAYADRILLGHADRVDEAGMARVRAAVVALNPLAEVRAAAHGAVEPGWVLGARAAGARALPEELPGASRHTPGLTSVSLTADAPVDEDSLRIWLEFLGRRRGMELMRCKGVLRRAGGGTLLIQGVYRWLEIAREEEPPRGLSRLVLIGKGLDAGELERGWGAVLEGACP